MKIQFCKYTKEDAERVRAVIRAAGIRNVEIIGGIKKRGWSNNDIDIYLPETEYNGMLGERIAAWLGMIRGIGGYSVTRTDWGGVYYTSRLFGNVDVFFKGQTDKFDY